MEKQTFVELLQNKFTQVDTNFGFYEAEIPCCANLWYREQQAGRYLAKETPQLASAHPQWVF